MQNQYYTVKQVAKLLHMAEGTVRNRLSRRKEMPPSVKDKDTGRRLFPIAEFHQWWEDKISRQ